MRSPLHLVAGLIAALALSTSAWGQETPADASATIPVQELPPADSPPPAEQVLEAKVLERVEVTGSRIKRSQTEGAQPVIRISRAELERTGQTSIGDILQELSVAGSALNNSFNNGGTGATEIDLRNLGSQRVLVLVNGRRWVNGLRSLSTSSVDLNTIPFSIVERIDVLKDGASAIYGSDAIAGVVNIITRKKYNGGSFGSQLQQFQDGDGRIQAHNLSIGRELGSSAVFADVSYRRQDAVFARDRAISAIPLVGTGLTRGSTFTPQGRFLFIPNAQTLGALQALNPNNCPDAVVGATLADETGMNVGNLPAGVNLCSITVTTGQTAINGTGNTTTPNLAGFRPYVGANDAYNYTDLNYLTTPLETGSLFTQFTHDFGEGLGFRGEVLYSLRRSSQQLAEQPLLTGDALFPPYSTVYVDATNIYNPFRQFGQDIGRSATTSTAGLGVGFGAALRRMTELGPRIFEQNIDTLRIGGALEGSFDVLSRALSWDVGLTIAESRNNETLRNQLNLERVRLALGPAVNCGAGCVPLNLFGGQTNPITREMLDYIAYDGSGAARQTLRDFTANLSGDLFDLPSGPVSLAMGTEIRRESYSNLPDPLVVAGISFGNQASPTQGNYEVKEGFFEVGVPVLREVPFAKSLDLSFAMRKSDYSLGEGATTRKLGLEWRPIADLLVRSTLSTAFRAPAITELFLGSSDSFPSITDPCSGYQTSTEERAANIQANCMADGVSPTYTQTALQILSKFQGNEEVEPETADTLTAGIVWSPSFIPNLNVIVDYFDIKVDNFIAVPGVDFIFDACYRANPNQRSLCEYVERQAGNGALNFVRTPFINFAKVQTAGWDMNVDYGLPIPKDFGRFRATLSMTYLSKFDQFVPLTDGGFTKDLSTAPGRSGNAFSLARMRINPGLAWLRGPWKAAYTGRFVSSTIEECDDQIPPSLVSLGVCSDPLAMDPGNPGPKNRIKSIMYHNVQMGYAIKSQKLDFTFGINNVLNRQPPISYTQLANSFDGTTYEIPGRIPYLKLEKKFD